MFYCGLDLASSASYMYLSDEKGLSKRDLAFWASLYTDQLRVLQAVDRFIKAHPISDVLKSVTKEIRVSANWITFLALQIELD